MGRVEAVVREEEGAGPAEGPELVRAQAAAEGPGEALVLVVRELGPARELALVRGLVPGPERAPGPGLVALVKARALGSPSGRRTGAR